MMWTSVVTLFVSSLWPMVKWDGLFAIVRGQIFILA